ncbi:hypothetical protein ABIA16_002594 [Sinorhizobium fredii]
MRMLRDFLARSAIAALFLLSLFVASHAADLTFEKDRIRLLTTGGRAHDLTVELAIDPEQREQGLMHRRQLAPDHGMLFDFGETRRGDDVDAEYLSAARHALHRRGRHRSNHS